MGIGVKKNNDLKCFTYEIMNIET